MQHIHNERYTIRSSEVGPNGIVRPDSIAALLQEIAGNHADLLEFDIKDLRIRNITWVLHKLQVKMYRYPSWRDSIEIMTWPSSGDNLRAYRDFRIMDQDGKELGVALSYWLLMDLKSRRPVRIPEEILQMGLNNPEHVIPVSKEKFNWSLEERNGLHFPVRRTDVDINQHANNVAYIRWLMESIDEETYMHGVCREFTVQYVGEARLGDIVQVYLSPSGESRFRHQLKSGSNTIAFARTNWEFQN